MQNAKFKDLTPKTELSPGVNIELDDKGKLIGIELFKASLLFRNVLELMGKKINQAA